VKWPAKGKHSAVEPVGGGPSSLSNSKRGRGGLAGNKFPKSVDKPGGCAWNQKAPKCCLGKGVKQGVGTTNDKSVEKETSTEKGLGGGAKSQRGEKKNLIGGEKKNLKTG